MAGQDDLNNTPDSPQTVDDTALGLSQTPDAVASSKAELVALKIDTQQQSDALKNKSEREKLRLDVEQRENALKTNESKVKKSKFDKKEYPDNESFDTALKQANTSIDPLEISVKIREYPDNLSKWTLDLSGLAYIRYDLENYGIYAENKALYDSIFATLYSVNKVISSGKLKGTVYEDYFAKLSDVGSNGNQSIVSSLSIIKSSDKDALKGINGENFASAYLHLAELKTNIYQIKEKQNKSSEPTTQESVLGSLDNGIADIAGFYKETFKSGNGMQIALLLGGTYLGYRAIAKPLGSKIFNAISSRPGATLALLGVVGAGVAGYHYGGDYLSEALGIDLPKMNLGGENPVADIISKNSDLNSDAKYVKNLKDYDPGVVTELGDFSMAELLPLYESGSQNGFIPPSHPLFNKIYPDYTYFDVEYLNKNEQALLESNSGLVATGRTSTDNARFVQKGRALYAAMEALRVSYSLSSLSESSKYKSLDLDELVAEKDLSNMRVSDLLIALSQEQYFDAKKLEEDVRSKDRDIFLRIGDLDLNARIDGVSEGFMHQYTGYFMGYPVYYQFNPMDNSYYVFSKKDMPTLPGASTIPPMSSAIFKIPKTGFDKENAIDKMWFKVWEGSVYQFVSSNFAEYGNIDNMAFGFKKPSFVLQYSKPNETFYTSAIVEFDANGNVIIDKNVARLRKLGIDPTMLDAQIKAESQEKLRIAQIKAANDDAEKQRIDDMMPQGLTPTEELEKNKKSFEAHSKAAFGKIVDEFTKNYDLAYNGYASYLDTEPGSSFVKSKGFTLYLKDQLFDNAGNQVRVFSHLLIEKHIDPSSLDLDDPKTIVRLSNLYFEYFTEKFVKISDLADKEINKKLDSDKLSLSRTRIDMRKESNPSGLGDLNFKNSLSINETFGTPNYYSKYVDAIAPILADKLKIYHKLVPKLSYLNTLNALNLGVKEANDKDIAKITAELGSVTTGLIEYIQKCEIDIAICETKMTQSTP